MAELSRPLGEEATQPPFGLRLALPLRAMRDFGLGRVRVI